MKAQESLRVLVIGLVTFSIIAFAESGLFVSPDEVKDEKIEDYRCERSMEAKSGKPRFAEVECVVSGDRHRFGFSALLDASCLQHVLGSRARVE